MKTETEIREFMAHLEKERDKSDDIILIRIYDSNIRCLKHILNEE